MFIRHLYIFRGEVSVQVFCLSMELFVFLFSFKSSLCILVTKPFSVMSFANISFQSVTRFLILLTVSFTEQFLILTKSGYPFFLSWIMPSMLYLISIFRKIQIFSYVIFQEFCNFAFYVQVYDLFRVHLCERCEVYVQILFFLFFFLFFLAFGCLVWPASFVGKTIFSPSYCLCSFVKHQLTICMWIYLGALYSVPSIGLFLGQYHTVLITVALQ